MQILIVGAGISGLATALALENVGLSTTIIEKFPCLRSEGAGIALPANAVAALFSLGLKTKLLQVAYRVKSVAYMLPNEKLLCRASLLEYPLNQYPFVALHRKEFLKLLADAVHSKIEFDKQIINFKYDENRSMTRVKFSDGKVEDYDLVISADGVNSILRSQLTEMDLREDLRISTWRFITNFRQKDPLYYFGKKSAFMIYPISQSQVYCYAHIFDPYKESIASKEYLTFSFNEYSATVHKLIQSISQQDIIFGRLASISTPIFHHKNIAFVGDAAHACSPMLQQGAASALEDAITLAHMLQAFPSTLLALKHYEKIRRPRAEWIKTNSDDTIKMLARTITDEEYVKRNQMIKSNGPINIQKWKMLFSTDYLILLHNYLLKCREKG